MSKKTNRLDNEQESYETGPAGDTDVVQRVTVKNTTSDPVPVLSTVATSTVGPSVGNIVSTSAVLIAASNTNRKAILITNNALVGKIYLGSSNAVTTSGATMGTLLQVEGGAYFDSGDGLYTGDIYAISDTATVVENISVSERT